LKGEDAFVFRSKLDTVCVRLFVEA